MLRHELKSVKTTFIYEKVRFVILSTRYQSINRQFFQFSSIDHFLSNIRCITVHVTMHFERNKLIFVQNPC